MTTNSSSTRFRNSSVRSTAAIPRTSAWWLTQTMPIMKKLIRYATKTGQWVPSWWSSVSWRSGLATMRLRASSVMATAKTPSLNASSLDLSTWALVQLAAGRGLTVARISFTQFWILSCLPGMSLLAKLSSNASTWFWPFRISICCLPISCSAISVSWSAMARRSLAACERFALTCSEIMIDSCGRLRITSSSGHGVLSKPTMLPRNSHTTMPIVMPRNTHIDPHTRLTPSAILSSRLVPRTWSDRTSLGWWSSGWALMCSIRSCSSSLARSIARSAAASVCGRGMTGDCSAACCPVGCCPVSCVMRTPYTGRFPGKVPQSAEGGQEDRLGRQVGVHALGPVRTALAAGAAAAPRGADVGLVQVHPERADPGPFRDVQAALRVTGPHGCGQPEPVVGERDRLGLVPVPDDGRDGTADLLLRDRHAWRYIGEHGRLVEVAAHWRGRAPAALHHPRAVGHPGADPALHVRPAPARGERAERGVLGERVADHQRRGLGGQRLDGFVVALFRHEDPGHGEAGLPRVAEAQRAQA